MLVLGGTGHFGARIAERLATLDAVEVAIAGRDRARVREVAARLRVDGVVLDRESPEFAERLRATGAAVLVNAAGPFQSQDYAAARTAIGAGVHYLDIADGRDFVCGIRTLDAEARRRGVAVVSGASSVPALSWAVVERLAQGLASVRAIDIGITTSARPPGLATVRAVLRDFGKPIPCWRDGRAVDARGGQGGWRRSIEGVGERRFHPCDVPDLALLRERYPDLRDLRFGAGPELALVHFGLGLVARAARAGLVADASTLAGPLVAAGRVLQGFGTGASAMYVEVRGEDAAGAKRSRSWELTAFGECGANIPTRAVVCLVRKLAGGRALDRGAYPAAGAVTLEEYLRELDGLDIHVRASEDAPS